MSPRIGATILALTSGCAWSCTKAQGTAVETVSIDATVCVLNHFSDPPQQIALECGLATVQDVVRILDAANAMQVRKAAGKQSVQP